MTLVAPKRAKNTTARLTAEQTQTALAANETQLAEHVATCAECQAGQKRSGYFIMHACPAGKVFLREHLELRHRLYYLAQKQRQHQHQHQQRKAG